MFLVLDDLGQVEVKGLNIHIAHRTHFQYRAALVTHADLGLGLVYLKDSVQLH